jgi:hypothetical protein
MRLDEKQTQMKARSLKTVRRGRPSNADRAAEDRAALARQIADDTLERDQRLFSIHWLLRKGYTYERISGILRRKGKTVSPEVIQQWDEAGRPLL